MTTPNRDDYSQHVEFNHVHHFGLAILSDFGGTEGPCLMRLFGSGEKLHLPNFITANCLVQILGYLFH